ncbi:MAG: hypothetical protein ACE361_26690 [Aureliella sp.]
MFSETPKAYTLASVSLCAAPLAMLMGFVGTKGLRSQDDSQAILYVMGIVLSVGMVSGIAALSASRKLGPERLRGKAITGIVLILGFAGILVFFVGA